MTTLKEILKEYVHLYFQTPDNCFHLSMFHDFSYCIILIFYGSAITVYIYFRILLLL